MRANIIGGLAAAAALASITAKTGATFGPGARRAAAMLPEIGPPVVFQETRQQRRAAERAEAKRWR